MDKTLCPDSCTYETIVLQGKMIAPKGAGRCRGGFYLLKLRTLVCEVWGLKGPRGRGPQVTQSKLLPARCRAQQRGLSWVPGHASVLEVGVWMPLAARPPHTVAGAPRGVLCPLLPHEGAGGALFSCGPCAHTLVPSRFNAFHPDTRKPMHRECGFIRLEPDTNKVAFVSAQNTGTLAGCTVAPALGHTGVPARGHFCGGQLGRRYDPVKCAGACLQSPGVPRRRGRGDGSRELAGFLSALVPAVTTDHRLPSPWHPGSVGWGPGERAREARCPTKALRLSASLLCPQREAILK